MKCPKCGFVQADGSVECRRCGVVFKKYLERLAPQSEPAEETPVQEEIELAQEPFSVRALLFETAEESNRLYFAGRAFLFLIILLWGIKLILTPMGADYRMSSFMHLVNLPFHEAGHVIFRPFGQWVTSLGGTLAQMLMPLVCLGVFLVRQRNPFAASVCLWWFGENFMDIAPYINDARALQLPLLGGNTGETSPYGFHDWEYILNEIGWIRFDHVIAHISDKTGVLIMLLSLWWGGYLLYKEYRGL